MGLLEQFIAVRRFILKPVSLGYANRVYVEQLQTVTPVSGSRHLYDTVLRTRKVQNVVVPLMDMSMTASDANMTRALASRINSRQSVDNQHLIVPKINEESRLGTGDDVYDYY